jgi:hypothetical protein
MALLFSKLGAPKPAADETPVKPKLEPAQPK